MTTTELGASWSERLNPRNWSLAWKLIAIGLVPALLALALGVLRIADQAGDAATLGTSNRLLEIRGQVAVAADSLRQERDEAALFEAAGRSEDRGVLDIGIGQSDATVQEAVDAVASAEDFDNTTRTALAGTQEALGLLGPLRNDVAAGPDTGADAVVQRYSGVIARVDGLERALLRQLRTPDVAGLADALTAATSAGEQLAVQHTVLGAAIRAGQLRPADVAASVAADNRLASEYSAYQVALTPEQLERFGTFNASAATGDLETVKNLILATPTDRPVVVDPAQWDAAYATALAAVQNSGTLIRDEMVALSTAAEERASNLAGINSVVLMLGLLVGITIAILVARALVRSLRVLRTAALDVAERRLPQAVESMRAGDAPDVTVDPVPLNTRDEVGQVARAFDAVHGQAIRLAADQAALQTNVSAMFVNLSRRSQALVERQLQLIEQLESNEQDPDQLSNLFQLDHLATRMRRLLVLAGTDLAKRNIAPVPMVDVLRAAVSEIEQYQRIVVQAPPTTTIVGRAASDLVHLLAELLDNATNFSPPDSQVVMSTTRTAEGDILVEIADRGVGMIDYELADANQRLGGPSSVDVSASRRMGLFVVGRLGARHGVQVQLSTSATGGAGTGLTASVTVPAQLVPTSEREVAAARPVAAVAHGGGTAFDVPPQRGAANGTGRTGSLSALVAGTDGPATPAAAFDPGPGGYPQVNGTGTPPSLPTRRPGSFLQSDDPSGPPSPAEQARLDQLAAAERAEREAQEPTPADRVDAERDTDRGDAEQADTADAAADSDGSDTTTTSYAVVAPRRDEPHAEPERARHAFAIEPDEDQQVESGYAAPAHALAEPHDEPGDGRADAQDDEPAQDEPSAAGSPNGVVSLNGTTPHTGPEAPAAPRVAPTEPANGSMPRNPWPQGAPPHRPAAAPAAPPANGNGMAPHPGNGTTAAPTGPSALPQRRPSPARPAAAPATDQGAPPTTPMPAVHRVEAPASPGNGVRPDAEPTTTAPDRTAAAEEQAGTASEPDGLFAPSVPSDRGAAGADTPPAPPAPEPVAADSVAADSVAADSVAAASVAAASVAPGPVASGRPEGSGFELGETTPIFEEIASAWFRSNRPLPVDWEAEARSAAPAPPVQPYRNGGLPPARAAAPPVALPPVAAPPVAAPSVAGPPPVPPVAPRPAPVAPVAPPAPVPPVAPAAPVPAMSAEPSGFSSPADEGWRAANNADPASDRPDEVTSAGLPKRRPRARLVPGSAGSAVLAPPVSSARSAEAVRGRLASYQQGVRQGRESRYRGDAGNGAIESANAGGNDEERQ
ncbi:nitrate- and nitrite sensing domain-containing protein [Pseudonocardia saturnea]